MKTLYIEVIVRVSALSESYKNNLRPAGKRLTRRERVLLALPAMTVVSSHPIRILHAWYGGSELWIRQFIPRTSHKARSKHNYFRWHLLHNESEGVGAIFNVSTPRSETV